MKKFISYLIIITLFIPLLVSPSFLFPYVFLKSIVFKIIVLLASFLFLFLLFKNKLYKLYKNWMVISFSLFLLILPILSIFSINFNESLWGGFERMEGVFYYFYLFLFLLILLYILRDNKTWKNIFISITISNILISSLAILQKFNINIGIMEYAGRIGGTLGNAAYLSSVLLFGLIFLSFFFYRYKKYRIFSSIAIILNIIAIFISATRGSLLALFFVILLSLLFSIFKKGFLEKKKKIILSSILIIFVLFISSIFIFKDFEVIKKVESLRRISNISLSDSTSASRLVIWKYSFDSFIDKPIFGWGLENFDDSFNKYYDNTISEEWFDRAHNNYLDILITGGIISLLIYLIFIFFVFKLIYFLYKEEKIDFISWQIFTFGFLAYLIQNIFIFDTLNTVIYLLFFIALLSYLNNASTKYIISILKVKIISIIFVVIILLLSYFTIFIPLKVNSTFMLAFNGYSMNNFEILANKSLQYNYLTLSNEEIAIYFSDLIRLQVRKGDISKVDWIIKSLEKLESNDIKIILNLSYFYVQKYNITNDDNFLLHNINILESTLKNYKNRYLLFEQLGKSYYLLKNKELAIENLELAFSIKNNEQSLWNLINVCIDFNDQYLLRYYSHILLNSNFNVSNNSINNLLRYFNNINDYEMLELLLIKLHTEKQSADILFDLAIIKLKLGKDNEAIEYANRAIHLNPELYDRLDIFFNF